MKIQRCRSGGRPKQKTIERRLNFLEKLPISIKDGSVVLNASFGLRKTYIRPNRGKIAEYIGFEDLNKENYKKLDISKTGNLVDVEMIHGTDFYRFSSKHPAD